MVILSLQILKPGHRDRARSGRRSARRYFEGYEDLQNVYLVYEHIPGPPFFEMLGRKSKVSYNRIGKLAKITQESGMTETFEEFMVSAPANALVNLFKVIGSCALL